MSEARPKIECMFDIGCRGLDDAGVVDAIGSGARTEAAAAAHRLAAVAELVRRRCGGDDRALWACDSWDAAAAEVSAAMGVSSGRASTEMYLAAALFTRLPRLAALFMQGLVGYRVVVAIVDRTDLVTEDQALAAIDEALAGLAGGWGGLSRYKLDQAVDVVVDRHDPGALRRTRANARSRTVEIGGRNDESGTSSLWGRLYATDAQILDRRLAAMAGGVCEHDPRTLAQRRADALGALAAGAEGLACRCDAPQCPAAGPRPATPAVVIHILAQTGPETGPGPDAGPGGGPDPDPDTGPDSGPRGGSGQDPYLSGLGPGYTPFTRGTDLGEYLSRGATPEPGPACPPGHGVILGGATVPGPLLGELLRSGAAVRLVHRPADAPESGYRPSAALAEFVRMRDMTCRFPHCQVPAQFCDIDHAIPWPCGPTHPSNLRCFCRKHHLLKTFWTGKRGWNSTQRPDATITWTSPAGAVYTTSPGSRLFFPTWNTTTAALNIPAPSTPNQPSPPAELAIPTRTRSRLAERTRRVRRERALNNDRVAERNTAPPF